MKGTLIVGAGLILVIAGIWAATRGGDEATVPGQPGAAVDAMDAGQVATPAPIELPDVGFGFKTPLAKPEPEDAAVKAVGMLTVISTPSGATVELDGGYVGKTPLVLQHDFEDREYEVKVLAEGYKPWQQRLRPHQQLRTINVVSILEKEERRR